MQLSPSIHSPFQQLKQEIGEAERASAERCAELLYARYFRPARVNQPDKCIASLPAPRVSVLERRDAASIRLYTWGEGPRALLVHGWSGNGGQLKAFVPALVARGFAATLFDLPAHGETSGDETDTTEIASVLLALEHVFGAIDVIVAHSYGAFAAAYALGQGLRARRIACLAAPDGSSFLSRYRTTMGFGAETAERLHALIAGRYARRGIDFDRAFRLENMLGDEPPPALFVHDARDPMVPHCEAERTVSRWPRAALHTTSGLGHTKILTSPDVIHRVVDFLRWDGG